MLKSAFLLLIFSGWSENQELCIVLVGKGPWNKVRNATSDVFRIIHWETSLSWICTFYFVLTVERDFPLEVNWHFGLVRLSSNEVNSFMASIICTPHILNFIQMIRRPKRNVKILIHTSLPNLPIGQQVSESYINRLWCKGSPGNVYWHCLKARLSDNTFKGTAFSSWRQHVQEVSFALIRTRSKRRKNTLA